MNRPVPGGETAGAKGIAIAVGAVIIGFIVAANFGDAGSSGLAVGSSGTDAPRVTTSTTVPGGSSTTTTIPLKDPKAVKVLPANGTKTSGASTKVGDAIAAGCWSVQKAVDATAKVKGENRKETTVYSKPGFEREAASVARQLGLKDSATAPLPAESPVPTSGVPAFDILVLVGQDFADSPPDPIPDLPCAPTESTTTTRRGTSGSTTTTRRTTTTKASTSTSARPTTSAP